MMMPLTPLITILVSHAWVYTFHDHLPHERLFALTKEAPRLFTQQPSRARALSLQLGDGRPGAATECNSRLDTTTINLIFPDAAAAIAEPNAEFMDITGIAPAPLATAAPWSLSRSRGCSRSYVMFFFFAMLVSLTAITNHQGTASHEVYEPTSGGHRPNPTLASRDAVAFHRRCRLSTMPPLLFDTSYISPEGPRVNDPHT
jgi:hypothetical protein